MPEYQQATKAVVAPTLHALDAVNLVHAGVHEQPWVGMSYVGICEYAGLGNRLSAEISAAIAGRQSVDGAMARSRIFARDVVEGGGYSDQGGERGSPEQGRPHITFSPGSPVRRTASPPLWVARWSGP
ncbi:hypothetical protein ACFZAV_33995 [Streptomyces sp. NPDC008343]|uniref:hypothetical protein n=1 Tax=Streptomyces sp. NPDC008343 TaxID=3364828 RepID=UPI0036E3F01D